jgi:hypothetical protein
MKTTIYWAMQHSRCAVHDFGFCATCWWLSQQVEFLEWRLKLHAVMPSAPFNSAPTPGGQGSRYDVHSM